MRGPQMAVLLAAACAPPRPAPAPEPFRPDAVVDRLYLGRNAGGREAVPDSAWESFLRAEVLPHFPGVTVLRAEGRWPVSADSVEAERSYVLEVVHPGDSASVARMMDVGRAYARRFGQSAVLRVVTPADSALILRPR